MLVALIWGSRASLLRSLEAVSSAFTGTPPGIGLALLHLLGLVVAGFGALARVALRFA